MHNCASKDQAQGSYAVANCERLEQYATQSAANHDHIGCHKKAPLYTGQSVSVINNDRILWPLLLLYVQLIMAPTSSKSLVEMSTNEDETTFMNVTQMLSSLICILRLKWLDNPSPLCQPQKLISKYLLFPQHNHLLLPQHPSQLQSKALQHKTPATADVQPLTSRTDITPYSSGHVSKAPQCIIEQM